MSYCLRHVTSSLSLAMHASRSSAGLAAMVEEARAARGSRSSIAGRGAATGFV